jgi:hypothetical protein
MAGINVIFDESEYIDHGSINREWFGPLDEGHSGWTCTVRLAEIPMEGENENLFVVLREEDTHTELEKIYIGTDPRDDDFKRGDGAPVVSGGFIGGHIREDGKLSIGTPYKAFATKLAYIGGFLYLEGNCALRVDELPDGQDPNEYWEIDRDAPIKEQGDAQSCQVQYRYAVHRVGGTTGEEIRKGHSAMNV